MDRISIPSPNDLSELWWKEVFKKVDNGVVFIDDFIAESLHYNGGIVHLFKSKCKDIKEFSSFEVSTNEEKAIFLLSSPLHGETIEIIKDIIRDSDFKNVVIITSCNQSVLNFIYYGDNYDINSENIHRRIEKDILHFMKPEDSSVEIFYFPLLLVPFLENVFLLPRFSNIFSLNMVAEQHLKESVTHLNDIEFHHLPLRLQWSIQHMVVLFHSFLQGMCAREEIYTVGHFSRLIGNHLETYLPARQRRKTASHKVSIVFVDRELDLVSSTDLDSSIPLNRILNVLHRLPGHCVDSEVDMSPVTLVNQSCSDSVLVPGSFVPPQAGMAKDFFHSSVYETRKELINNINKKIEKFIEPDVETLGETLSREESLHNNILKFMDCEDVKNHFHLVQQGLGLLQALQHPRNDNLNRLYSLQKHILQSFNESKTDMSPVQQVLQLLKTRDKTGIRLSDVLNLLLHVASLCGSSAFHGVQESSVLECLSNSLIEDKDHRCPVLSHLVDSNINQNGASILAATIWHRLLTVSNARNQFQEVRHLYHRQSEMEPVVYQPLLSKLMRDILQPSSELPDYIACHSLGFKDMIKTGFSLFVNVTKPKPKEAALLIVYVIGGVAPSELKAIEEEIRRSQPDCRVLIGSSHLTYPDDVTKRFFKTS